MDTRGFNEKDIMSSLDGIAEAISAGGGGGSSLPEVNSGDNGKVLTVVNGAWDKATASGGGEQLCIVNISITIDEETGTITSQECDKTYEQVLSDFNAGKLIVFKCDAVEFCEFARLSTNDNGFSAYHIEWMINANDPQNAHIDEAYTTSFGLYPDNFYAEMSFVQFP